MRPGNLRAAVLPGVAATLVCVVLGVQVANGGGDFVPARPADPCIARVVAPIATGDIEALGTRLVLLGLDGAACRLHISRETLVLQLAQPGTRTDAEIDAIRAGLLGAVDRMKADGTLPPASDFTDEALANANLPGYVKWLIRHLPDSVVNGALKTDDVLRRAINDLDLRALMADLSDTDDLNRMINAAITKAVRESLIARLRGLLPG
ncbi:hypothetical protein [Smaragdicoccus niigatensis]|uniref:hypothetical protein n=1 Tax=Smaragdicoccus niigatensis TaxID=359359 RepID=UPI0003699055|nr:hypothetical protein [Smaragdicoccus niigatensis]